MENDATGPWGLPQPGHGRSGFSSTWAAPLIRRRRPATSVALSIAERAGRRSAGAVHG